MSLIVNMRTYEKQLLDKRLKDFMEEVIPVELFPFMPSLIAQDKEEIQAMQTNHGPIKATMVLVDRLKRRDKGFQHFVQALRKCGGEHTALLLDPYYRINDDDVDDKAAEADASGLAFRMIGTAIDVRISGDLLPEGSDEQTDVCCRLEKRVVERYNDQKSEENKRMRKELQERLPQGVVFVNTEKGSIISTFRLSSENAANELWEMYTKGSFQSMLQKVLVVDTLKDEQDPPEKPPELKLSLGEERFEKIRKKLAEIERDQERENLLSFPGEQENGSIDDEDFEIPPVFLGTKANSIGGCELVLREYQKELAEPAIQGKNTIICAPTNSGKTYVAIEIAKKHLDSFASDADQSAAGRTSKEGRVVFIVSTVNLVLQQKERFEAFLGDKYNVGEISGANSTEIPLKFLLQHNHVVVMTAQILVNALKSDVKGERVELKDISLLLFDECHHAHKEHPYNSIMEKYLALKAQAGKQHRLPQIIGLTASLGTGKAKSVEKAEEHIILVSANLDAEVISTVQKNREELERFVNVPKRETHFVAKDEQDPFETIVSKVMNKIEAQIKRLKGKSYKAGPPDKAGQQYRQWVEELYKDSVADGDRYLVTFTEHLREYHVALTLNTNTRMKNARKYLDKYFDALDREKFTETDKNLVKLFEKAMNALDLHIEKQGEPQNPRLIKLKELLLQNYENTKAQKGKEEKSNKTADGEDHDGGGDEERSERYEDTEKTTKGSKDASKDERDDGNDIAKDDAEKNENNLGNEEDAKAAKESPEESGSKGPNKDGPSEKIEENLLKDATNQDSVKQDEMFDGDDSEAVKYPSKTVQATSKDAEAKKDGDGKIAQEEPDNISSNSSDSPAEDEQSDEKSEFHPEWEGPKGILFTRTRESTEALLDWIKETEELDTVLRPEPLVGSGDGNIGMTQKEQEGVIKRFKTGEKNLLLATSVAEEGLDISDCNYVIRYDMMGNEISSVQSRGRVRAQDGKYSVLVGHSGAMKREHTSSFREFLMTEALTKVQGMDAKKFTETVKGIQRKISQDRYLKKHVCATQKSVIIPGDVTFCCRKCKEVACQAHDVRRIKGSHHVIISRDCKETKVDIKEHPNPKKIDDIEMNKKIFCKKCHEDWGVTALIHNMEWLCIKISSFVLEFPGGDRPKRMYKKWKDLPFGIKEATTEEILELGSESGDDLLNLDL